MHNKKGFNRSKQYKLEESNSSSIRLHKNIVGNKFIIKSGKGVVITDENDREYIDFLLGGGSLILGHSNDKVVESIQDTCKRLISFDSATRLELRLSELLCETMRNVEMVRMVNSELEAKICAINLAKRYTKRNKIVRFEGCYEGEFKSLLLEADLNDTLVCKYNDENQLRELFKEYGKEIAAVVIEPVAGNIGSIKAEESFMKKLRMYCDRFGALLIFDESISGFRVLFNGGQTLFDVKADLIIYAKILGGGLPCGAYGGKKNIMELVNEDRTIVANPLVMSAGLATLNQLYDHPEYYNHIERIGKKFEDGLYKIRDKYNLPIKVNRVGGMMTIFFTDNENVTSYEDVKKCDLDRFERYFNHMKENGFNIPKSQFDSLFLSTEHNITHIFKFIKAFEEFAKKEIN